MHHEGWTAGRAWGHHRWATSGALEARPRPLPGVRKVSRTHVSASSALLVWFGHARLWHVAFTAPVMRGGMFHRPRVSTRVQGILLGCPDVHPACCAEDR